MSVKEWLMMGTKKVGVLSSPQKKTVIFISEKKRTCKEHELTDNMKGIKILGRRKSEKRENEKQH